MVESTRETGGKIESETRFSITSTALPADRLGPVIRGHQAVENSLPWVMVITFRTPDAAS